MRHRATTLARAAIGVAAGVLLAGCATATSSVPGGRDVAAQAAAGSWTSLASASRPLDVVESRTVSFALDRIDQRDLPLDHRFQRRGTGSGVTVYVFDGGISATHPELAGRVRTGFTAFPADAAICNPHGTAVAGAVAGSTLGVAPGVELVDVKMVDCARVRGTIQGIVDATRWVLEDVRRNPGRRAVANWSFIADTAAVIPALDSAVHSLVRAGIPVVVSAGNVATDACRVSPANSRGAIVVGASAVMRDAAGEIRDRRAPGTAYGPCIDVYAPGDSVLLPSLDARRQHTTQLWNGTSMSAGYVSGAIALYLEANPTASPAAIASWLRATGTPGVVAGARSAVNHLLFVGARERTDSIRVTMR